MLGRSGPRLRLLVLFRLRLRLCLIFQDRLSLLQTTSGWLGLSVLGS
jgi:hypothetical protein